MGLLSPSAAATIWQSNLPATPATSTGGTQLTANASINTKAASYTDLITSTTYDSYGFYLSFFNSSSAGTDTSMLMDIALGSAGNEAIILPDYMCGFRSGLQGLNNLFVPIFIPRGSRVSGRTQALITADTIRVGVQLIGGASRPLWSQLYTGCDAYGISAADSGGTAHTPGNSGAESTDANVGSTLSRNYKAVALGLGSSGITTINSLAYHIELTDGTNTLAEWFTATNTSEEFEGIFPNAPIPINLPAATQLQVQAECSGTAQAIDVAFYCFY